MNNKEVYLSKPWLKYYPEDVPKDVDIPNISLPEIFEMAAERYKNNIALIFYGTKITYKTLKKLINSFAAAMRDLGVKKEDTVAIYLLNSPQYIIAYFASLKLGAKVKPISPVYTSQELKHQIEDSKAKTVICEEILYDKVQNSGVNLDNAVLTNIGDYLPFYKRIFVKNKLSKAFAGKEVQKYEYNDKSGMHSFKKLIDQYSHSESDIINCTIDPKNDIAVLPYTGGTTGFPKAAILTHYNMVALVHQVIPTWPFLEEGKENSIAFLPLFHIYGQVVLMLSPLCQGHTLVLFTTPDIDAILFAIERYKASCFVAVPAIYERLKEYDKTDRVNWKNLKILICGADTLHKSTVEDWNKRTGTMILEGYGMTETSGVSHVNPYTSPRVGSFGVPIPGVTAAIVDINGTEFMPVNEVGEMILNGPNIMQGYWERPDDTKESIIEIDGKKWLRTGDLVRMDEDGYFYFFDRKRDLIKYKGYSVFAKHVEEVLYNHPQIKAAGVVGVPDPKVGNIIKAYVVLESDARGKISEQEIIDFCRENLAHYKIPKIIEFRGELPMTDVGKISRRELREESDEA